MYRQNLFRIAEANDNRYAHHKNAKTEKIAVGYDYLAM